MPRLTPTEQEIAEEFELFDDPMERYEHLIDMGRELPGIDEAFKRDEYVVKGCQSTVWLRAFTEDGRIYFQADSNTAITKGIVGLLVQVLSGLTPQEVVDHPLGFIDAIDLRSHLTSQRSNGLNAMIARMRAFAAGLADG